jgi:hypothetical protein
MGCFVCWEWKRATVSWPAWSKGQVVCAPVNSLILPDVASRSTNNNKIACFLDGSIVNRLFPEGMANTKGSPHGGENDDGDYENATTWGNRSQGTSQDLRNSRIAVIFGIVLRSGQIVLEIFVQTT